MTRLARDVKAFAKRVQIGTARVWLVVEGRKTDRPFYDRLLSNSAVLSAEQYSIRTAEEIKVEGVSAGGKAHQLAIYNELLEDNSLSLENNLGVNKIGFALDRDFDDIAGRLVESDHIIYTVGMDAEADILVYGDLIRAISSTYSVDSSQASLVAVGPGKSLAEDLATHWIDWIDVGVQSDACGVDAGFRYSKLSPFHLNHFGEIDEAAQSAALKRLQDAVESALSETTAYEARRQVRAIFEAGEHWRLLKGRWIASYISYLVSSRLSEIPLESNIQSSTLIKTCLETLNFHGEWATIYYNAISRLAA